jgi:DNA-binding GntR family transcriptional regulator
MSQRGSGTTVAEVVEELRKLILSGTYLAGQPLRQDELAARFGVSRTPLREAVARLEVEGLVVTEPNRGAVVFRPSTKELAEIYEVRLLLEPRAAALAAATCGGQTLDDLEEINQSMVGASAWEYAQLNGEFHMKLYELSGHSRLCTIIRSLRMQADPYVSMLIGGGGGPQALADHREILRLVRRGESVLVEELTRQHLQRTVERVMPMINRLHGDGKPTDEAHASHGATLPV